MRKVYFIFMMALLGSVAASCDLLEYHPYEGKISGELGLTARHVERIETFGRGRRSCRFAFITDTQRWYDETEEVVKHINARGDIDFVVHGGDLTDFGATNEFEWMRDDLSKLKMPYVTVIGNHDCLGHGEHIYQAMFGDYNYGFTVGNVRFECLNTVALEYDYSNPVPDFGFLKREQQLIDSINSHVCPDSITHSVFVMHSHPYDEQFNNNVAEMFDYVLCKFPGMTADAPVIAADDSLRHGTRLNGFCLNGHNHSHDIRDLFADGVLYYGCPNIKKRQYYVFTIHDEGYDFEEVTF